MGHLEIGPCKRFASSMAFLPMKKPGKQLVCPKLPTWLVPHPSSPSSHYYFVVVVKTPMKIKVCAYNLHFKTGKMADYTYLSTRGTQNWSCHLRFPSGIKFGGETQPWSPSLPRSVRSDASPAQSLTSKRELPVLLTFLSVVPGCQQSFRFDQPSRCDT